MKQRVIKLPFTCSTLFKALYLFWIGITVTTTFYIDFDDIGKVAFYMASWFCIFLIALLWWVERIGKSKVTFPFRFSCKCEDDVKETKAFEDK